MMSEHDNRYFFGRLTVYMAWKRELINGHEAELGEAYDTLRLEQIGQPLSQIENRQDNGGKWG
jgi:hypothetical protein